MTGVAIREPELLSKEDIKKYAGRWVAIKDGIVVKDAGDPDAVYAYLEKEGIQPDIVRRLPIEPEPDVWVL